MVKAENLVKTYNKGKSNEFQALKGVSFEIADGDMVAIIGKSGAGKSTLLHILGGIDRYESGSCLVDGEELSGMKDKALARFRNQRVGTVMQDFALVNDYTVEENVQIPLYFGHVGGSERKERARKALERVGIAELAKKDVNKLSGGQKQRVAIARAIVNDPSYILADEPTGALDTETSGEIIALFKKLNEEGNTVIIVTHDMDVAASCKRILRISDGQLVREEG